MSDQQYEEHFHGDPEAYTEGHGENGGEGHQRPIISPAADEDLDPIDSAPAPAPRNRRARSATVRPTEPLYSLDQVAHIIDFAIAFDEGTDHQRDTFFNVFGYSNRDVDGLQVAALVTQFPNDLESYGLLEDLVAKLTRDGGIGFVETVALVGRFSTLPADVVSSFVTAVNAVTFYDHPIEQGRRVEITDILTVAVQRLTESPNHDALADLPWIRSLIDLWPGQQ